MSSIDERIVAMRFNNSQFEKGVKESMRTLAELREATNLDDVAANMKDVSKSINQNLQFESPTKSAGIFSKALTSLGKVAKTTFNAATFPLQALGRSLQSLGKYTRAVLGIDIASQLVHTGEQVIRTFTIDPLKSGWNEYELKMDSIKTIMTGTVKTYTDAMTKKDPQFLYDEEKHLDYVKRGLEELNTYADQTVYSFQDMTSNIGKFTNAGVDFETAVDAIKGVANAAAHAGQGASQASSAMYNISQSLGMGYLGMMDWRSIENANMATLTFKQTLIDMGVALGQLKKDEQSGKLYTINEKGVVDTSLEVTAENLRETLSKKWVNKEVLLNALRVYSGEFSEEELQSLKNLTDEEKAQLRKIGEEAALAATQVRTFTKMWDALKEAAQSGWAISWELIFGDLNEATNFWTDLNKRFSGFLDQQAESRNALLHAWRGQRQQYNYETGEIEWISDERLVDGRNILVDALHEMMDAISEVGSGISEAWSSIFGTITGQNLIDVTKKFKGFTKAFSDWVGKRNDPTSRISKLTAGLKGIFSVLKGAGSVVGGAIATISQSLRLDKLLDAGVSIFGKAGEWLGSLGASISGVWESIGQTEIMQKLSGFFDGLWDSVSKFFTKTNAETGNTGFVDWLQGVTSSLNDTWTEFTKTDFYKKAGEIWGSVVDYFSPKTIWGRQGKKRIVDSQFMSDIKAAFKGIESAWTSFSSSDFVQNAISFFSNLWSSVSNFFFVPGKDTGKTGLADWFDATTKNLEEKWNNFTGSDFYKNAEEVFTKVKNYFSPRTLIGTAGNTFKGKSQFEVDIGKAFHSITGLWTEFTNSDFYESATTFFSSLWASISGFFTEVDSETGNTGFMDFVINAITNLRDTWENVKNSDFVAGISTFFSNLWSSVSGFVQESITIPDGGSWEDSPIGKAITSVGGWLQSGWTWIEANLGPVAEQVGSFLTNTWSWIMGKVGGGEKKQSKLPEIPKNAVKLAGKNLMTDFKFEDLPEEAKQNKFLAFFESLFSSIGGFVEQVKDWNGWGDIAGFFRTMFEGLRDAFNAIGDITGLSTLEAIGSFLSTVIGKVAELIGTIMNNVIKAGNGDLVAIATLIANLGGFLTAMWAFSTVAKGFGEGGNGLMQISASLLMMAGAIALLGGMPITQMLQGAIAVSVLGVVFEWIMPLITKFSETLSRQKPLEGGWKVLDNLLSNIAKIALVIAVMDRLPSIMSAYDGSNGKMDGFLGFAGGIAVLLVGLSAAFRILKGVDLKSMVVSTIGISLAVTTFLTLANGIGAMFNAFPAIGDNFAKLGEGIGRFIGSITGTKQATELTGTTKGMAAASNIANGIDKQGLERLELAMDAFEYIGNHLPNDPSIFERFFGHKQSMSDFATNVSNLGAGLKNFSDSMTGIADFSMVEKGITAIGSLLNAAALVEALNEVSGGSETTSGLKLIDFLTSMAGELHDIKFGVGDGDFSGFADFAGAINLGILESSEKITVAPIITAIKNKLSTGTSEITEAMNSMFSDWNTQTPSAEALSGFSFEILDGFSSLLGLLSGDSFQMPEIQLPDFTDEKYSGMFSGLETALQKAVENGMNAGFTSNGLMPVYDIENESDLPMLAYQNGSLTLTGTVQIDTTSFSNVVSAINSNGSRIVAAVNNMGARIDSLGAAISRIQIVLDTGAVAGAVDAKLGQSTTLQSRTGTTSGITRIYNNQNVNLANIGE